MYMKYLLYVLIVMAISIWFTQKKGSVSFLGIIIATLVGCLILKYL